MRFVGFALTVTVLLILTLMLRRSDELTQILALLEPNGAAREAQQQVSVQAGPKVGRSNFFPGWTQLDSEFSFLTLPTWSFTLLVRRTGGGCRTELDTSAQQAMTGLLFFSPQKINFMVFF